MHKALPILLVVTAATFGCDGTGASVPMCHCPNILAGSTVIQLPCGTADPPAVKILSGPCGVRDPVSAGMVELIGSPGACRVELMFAGGTKTSVDVNFTAGPWMACGSDPHGCGRSTFAEQPVVQIGDVCADAGTDSGASK